MARAGLFRERVTFQRMASTTDDYGNVTAASWSNIVSRNAELTERTGFQNDEQGALQDVAIARMKVRSDTQIKAVTIADRVSARNTLWAIKSISTATPKGDILECVLEKGVAT